MAEVAGGPSAETRRSRFQGVRLGDRTSSRDNNFDLLRLLAAWAVLVSHSYALVGEDQPLTRYNATLGNVGVLVFFGVSGLLITRSWVYDPSPRDFWAKRALRLLPALAAVAVLTAFVVGPLVTTASLGDYFSSWETWVYPFRITLMMPFGAQLPGVFDDNVYAGAVNGSLWSLPVEVFAYAVLAVLGVTGMLRHRKLVLAIAVVGVLWSGVWVSVTPPAIGSTFVLAAFAVGVAAWSYRDRIVLSWPIAGAVLVVSALAALGPMGPRVMVWTVAAVYLSYFVAYALPNVGRFVTRSGDASYGVYIWAFPIQQVIYQVLGPDIGPWTMIAIATPIVWVLAQLSWHLIESPALRHKPRRPGEAGQAAADTTVPVVDSGVRQSP